MGFSSAFFLYTWLDTQLVRPLCQGPFLTSKSTCADFEASEETRLRTSKVQRLKRVFNESWFGGHALTKNYANLLTNSGLVRMGA